MAEKSNLFLKKTFAVVTGASRGLGKAISLQFSSKFPPSSVVVLMARNVHGLESVMSEINTIAPKVIAFVRKYDQGNVEDDDYFNNIFDDILKENSISKDDFEQYMIVHNCASKGDVTKTALDMSNSRSVRESFDLNLTGMILLNTSFFKTFSDSKKSRVVVNMTSGSSVHPSPSLSLYGAGKAARDMFFRVLAAEEPTIRILTYAPGLCDTEMYKNLETNTSSTYISGILQDARRGGMVVSAEKGIDVLLKLLEDNTFENAAFSDRYAYIAQSQ